MTHENKYRRQAKVFLRRMTEARLFFDKHKPSVGFVGEYLLRKSLHALLSNDYGICQGFVIYGKEISRQCDIIIFKKGEDSISKSYGELKIVNAEKVVAVIEVKSSIKKDTFFSTLKAFEELHTLRVTNCFLFVYGQLSRRKMYNWLFIYKCPNTSTEQYIVTDSYMYDWPDIKWLPNSVLALESNKYFKIDHILEDNGDWVGYTSLKLKDSKNAQICCLQEFFSDIVSHCEGMMSMDLEDYSIEHGIELFRV